MRYSILAIWVGIATAALNFVGWIAFGFCLTLAVIASLLLGILGFLLVRLSWWLARIRNPGQDVRW
jgi:multidrug transporter EmrE-like cation transporter